MDAPGAGQAACSAIVAELMESVDKGLQRVVVIAEVLQAARELRGQIWDGSQQELLFWLAATRITRWAMRT